MCPCVLHVLQAAIPQRALHFSRELEMNRAVQENHQLFEVKCAGSLYLYTDIQKSVLKACIIRNFYQHQHKHLQGDGAFNPLKPVDFSCVFAWGERGSEIPKSQTGIVLIAKPNCTSSIVETARPWGDP